VQQVIAPSALHAEGIIASARSPVLVLDQDLKVVTGNHAYYRMFNVSKAETQLALVYDLGEGQWDLPALRQQLEDLRDHGRPFQGLEIDQAFPTIGRRVLRLSADRLERLAADSTEAELMIFTIEDVTASNRSEERLKWSEQRYRRLFESAQDGILILDATSGVILDANPFLARLLGYGIDELVGKQLWQIGLFEDIEASGVALAELKRIGYIRYEHLPLETTDGRQIDVEFVSNVYGEGHQQVIQCNIRDITARRSMESTVRRQVADLAEASRQKDEFLAMLSHELRNPLGAIRNAVQVLRHHPDEDPIQAVARGMIVRQVSHLSRLVDDLLEISRVTAGRIILHPQRIEAREIVERSVETVRSSIVRRRQELSVSLPAQPIWLNVDPTRLEQVLVNLLTNAVKYSDEGGRIWLTVSVEGRKMVLRVRDAGIGISTDLLPQIFDLFTQADRSLDRSQGGLGIGLTLVHRLVELHGGTVEAHSGGLGRGSEFIVRLPLGSVLNERATPAAVLAEPLAKTGRPLRILVVDDNEDSAQSLSLLLLQGAHTVRIAHSGPAALEVALAFRPEVLLLDLGLPQMDGYEVARRLREQAELGGMVVVAVTGYAQQSDRQRSRQAGFDFHLVKPVDLGELQRILVSAALEPSPHVPRDSLARHASARFADGQGV
jgi:PAS domain S-box-containing protein